jgi:2,3-bisphosphoglycerate-dependent phosphoglycerate mutase
MWRTVLFAAMIGSFGAAAMAQETVLIIRHAEKAEGADPALTDAGRLRALSWAQILGDSGVQAVVTSDARRTKETGAIIAAALSIPQSDWPADDSAGLIDFLSFDYEGETVLVVGHTETIPSMLRQLGVGYDIEIAQSAFDNLFIVSGIDAGQPSLMRLHMP